MTVHTCMVGRIETGRPPLRYPSLCVRHQRSLAERGIEVEQMTGAMEHVCDYCEADRLAEEG